MAISLFDSLNKKTIKPRPKGRKEHIKTNIKLMVVVGIILISLGFTAGAQTNPVVLDIEHFSNADGILLYGNDDYRSYIIQSSTNLIDWTDRATINTSESGSYETFIPTLGTLSTFYRSKCGPIMPHIVVALDPSSPLPGLVRISRTNVTHNIALAVFDVKSVQVSGTLKKVTVTICSTKITNNISATFNDIKLRSQGMTWSATTVDPGIETKYLGGSYAWEVTFTNLDIVLPSDTHIPLTILADIIQDSDSTLDGVGVSAILSAYSKDNNPNPLVEDSGSNTFPVQSAGVGGVQITLFDADAFVDNTSATLGSAITSNNVVVGYNVNFSFTMTAGDQTLFLAASATNCLEYGVISNGTYADLSLNAMTANPGSLSGDTGSPPSSSGYYIIPAGSSRQFTFNGVLRNTSGTAGLKIAGIIGVFYGTSPGNIGTLEISYGLQNLRVNASF